ncbi:hypothetical protein HSHS1_00440 [Helicobacter suis HS1]|nr:hypothetical protein HSHS1_00440 [Helicobacter suis HS1]
MDMFKISIFSVRAIFRKNASEGLFVSIKDHGSNITGALGLNPFFEGNNARDIKIIFNQSQIKGSPFPKILPSKLIRHSLVIQGIVSIEEL